MLNGRTPPGTAGFLRKSALNLLLLFASLVIALGLGEVVVRAVAPQQLIIQRPELYRPMDSLGYAHRPNVDLTVNTGDRTVAMHTDSSGFRVGANGRPPGRYRVLLLGDSFMAAMQVEYEQSLPGLIERCFETRTGQSAAVWNTGVAGWDPPQYYIQARRALETGRFDVVLVAVFLGNDIVERRVIFPPREADREHTFRLPRRFTWAEIVDALLYPVNDFLERKSHLFVFVKNRSQNLLMRVGLTPIEVPSILRRSEAQSPRWGVTADILADIDSVAKTHGAPVVFALIPAIEQVEPAVFQERIRSFGIDSSALDLDQPERLMIHELQLRNLTYVSLLPALRAAQARGVTLYGRVDMHPSADGHRVMWDGIAPILARTLGLQYHPDPGAGPPCSPP
jgi:hypothetical protein